MNKWIKTEALFMGDFEDIGIEPTLEERKTPFTFKLNEVIAFNESTHEGFTTIWFKNSSISINIDYCDFQKIINKYEDEK